MVLLYCLGDFGYIVQDRERWKLLSGGCYSIEDRERRKDGRTGEALVDEVDVLIFVLQERRMLPGGHHRRVRNVLRQYQDETDLHE